MTDQSDQKQDKEKIEENLCDSRRSDGNSGKPEKSGHERNDKKSQCPT
jgi:hypothetical protein